MLESCRGFDSKDEDNVVALMVLGEVELSIAPFLRKCRSFGIRF